MRPELIARVGAYSAEAAERAVQMLLSAPAATRPTAIFSTDGLMSGAVMAALNARDLAVPGDLSLICFDDLDWMGFHRPGISAVLQPMAEIGRAAAELLLERLASRREEPRHVVLPARLIHRGSVTAPRG